MKIADLFVDLGVTGNEKSIGAIAGMRKGMGDLSSTSLEAKAAIIGAMYALQRMFAASGQTGTNLNQFSQLVDTSTKTLQQYQWAAQQVGVSNQEMAGTFLSMQDAMNKIILNEGAPKLLAQVHQLTRDFGDFDILEYQKTPEKLIQRLQAYAMRETNTGIAREALKSFGVSDAVFAAMRQNAFRPEVLNRAPVYTDSEIKSLSRADAAWKNLGTSIEMAFGRFNAKHGEELVANIEKIVKSVIKLSESFMTFAERIGLFDKITKIFDGWKLIFDLISSTIKDIQKMDTPEQTVNYFLPEPAAAAAGSKTGPTTIAENQLTMLLSAMMLGQKIKDKNYTESAMNFGTGAFANRLFNLLHGDEPTSLRKVIFGTDPNLKPAPAAIAPSVPASAGPARTTTNNNVNMTVPQTLNFNGNGADPKQASESQKKAADAFFSSPARGWGN